MEDLLLQLQEASIWEGTLDLKRNEFLKTQHNTDTNIYFVLDGSLRIYIIENNEELTIRFAYKSNLITDLVAFITDKPSDFTIQAIKKSSVYYVSKKRFLDFINQDQTRMRLWQEMLYQLVLQQIERERDLLTSSPTERYLRVLKRSPQLFQEIPNKFIASYLRMTPETLSRIKKS